MKKLIFIFVVFLISCNNPGDVRRYPSPDPDLEITRYWITSDRSIYIAKFKNECGKAVTTTEQIPKQNDRVVILYENNDIKVIKK